MPCARSAICQDSAAPRRGGGSVPRPADCGGRIDAEGPGWARLASVAGRTEEVVDHPGPADLDAGQAPAAAAGAARSPCAVDGRRGPGACFGAAGTPFGGAVKIRVAFLPIFASSGFLGLW